MATCPEGVEIAQAQAPSMAAESLLAFPWGLRVGPGLAWDARPTYIHMRQHYCSTAQGIDNLLTLGLAKFRLISINEELSGITKEDILHIVLKIGTKSCTQLEPITSHQIT
jgi:hypothetical protein